MIKDSITTREKIALNILRVMFLIVAPCRDYDFKNSQLMEELFDE